MSRHPQETDLALFVSNDVSLWKRIAVRVHSSHCDDCRVRIEAYRLDRQRRKREAADLPAGIHWERLAAEMTANIRVGLAAGECVAPKARKHAALAGWRPAAAAAAVVVLLAGAWWLNLPASDTQSLGRAMQALVHGRPGVPEERGPVVAASSKGIELRENGGSLAISEGSSLPVAITVSAPGSASARYVDGDTGQITITSVYVQ